MRHLGLFAFGVTTCVLVPTTLHLLEAGPAQLAKLVAPGARTLTVGKAQVDVGIDRALVVAGEKVHVTLTASAETRQRVTLDILVLESTGTSGGRVETPPVRLAREEVTLDTKGGSATKTFAFTLPGNRAETMGGTQPFGHYTFLVMPPADADKFEHLRRRAASVKEPMEDPGGRNSTFEQAFDSISLDAGKPVVAAGSGSGSAADAPDPDAPAFGTPGQIARLDVNTRPSNSPVAIVAAEQAHPGDDIAVTVRVHNASKTPFGEVHVSLSTHPYMLASDFMGIPEEQITLAEPDQVVTVGARATTDVVFHVSTKATGVMALYAQTYGSSEGHDGVQDAAVSDVALDAIEIVPADHAPAVVQK